MITITITGIDEAVAKINSIARRLAWDTLDGMEKAATQVLLPKIEAADPAYYDNVEVVVYPNRMMVTVAPKIPEAILKELGRRTSYGTYKCPYWWTLQDSLKRRIPSTPVLWPIVDQSIGEVKDKMVEYITRGVRDAR